MPTPDASLLADRFPTHMRPSDAVLWDIEKDPVLRSTITAIALLDRAPDWDRLVHRMEYASRIIPRLRQRVIVPPLRVGPPHWVVDPAFDLSYHLRRARVPAPGTLRAVLDLAQPLSMAAFDRARPLWEFTLVEGMADGRAALIQKVHHTVTDGLGGVQLALAILDEHRDDPEPALPAAPAADDASRLAATLDALAGATRTVGRTAVAMPVVASRAMWGAARRPVERARSGLDLAASIGKTVAPVPESQSSLLTERSLQRRFETIDIRLADLRAAAEVASSTINDAFMASVVEGLRRYHARHGAELAELRLTMPISLRTSDDDLGNHFVPARFTVPTTIADPIDRMQQLGAIARAWREEPALDHADGIAMVLDRLPLSVTTGVLGAMLKHVDAVVTNVPGIPVRSYLGGAEVVREYAFAPPTGAAINVALLSHVDEACIGIVCDGAAVPDDDVLVSCLVEGFDEVVGTADHHAERTA